MKNLHISFLFVISLALLNCIIAKPVKEDVLTKVDEKVWNDNGSIELKDRTFKVIGKIIGQVLLIGANAFLPYPVGPLPIVVKGNQDENLENMGVYLYPVEAVDEPFIPPEQGDV